VSGGTRFHCGKSWFGFRFGLDQTFGLVCTRVYPANFAHKIRWTQLILEILRVPYRFFLPDTDFWAPTFSRLIMAATPKLNQTSGLIWTKLCRSKGQPTNHLLINNIINIYILFMLLRRKARCSNGTNITFLEKRRVENPIIIHRLSLNPKKHQEKLTPHQTTTKLL